MFFIAVTLFLDVLGLGIIIPVLPDLVTDFLGGDASRASSYFGLIGASYAATQFVFAPLLGSLSDRFGRRPVILAALTGFGLSYLLMGLAPSLAWLFVARVLAGFTGASITTAQAYIADVSNASNRAQNFGVVGAVFGLGFIAGPALGGLLGHLGPRVPFFAAATVTLANVLYGLFVLPESLSPALRRPFSWRRANPLGGLIGLKRHATVARLAVAFVLMSLAQRGLENVWVLYTRYRFGWDELDNGLALALVGVCGVIVQGFLIRKIVPRIGERRAALTGLAIAAVGMILYGLSASGPMMLGVIVLASLGGIGFPAIQGIVAGSVSPSEQGSVQGTLTSLVSLTAIAAPLLSSQLFRVFTGPDAPAIVPGAPFFMGAVFLAVSLALTARALRGLGGSPARQAAGTSVGVGAGAEAEAGASPDPMPGPELGAAPPVTVRP